MRGSNSTNPLTRSQCTKLLHKGKTCVALNVPGNQPFVKDRFAMCRMIGSNKKTHSTGDRSDSSHDHLVCLINRDENKFIARRYRVWKTG